MEKGISYLNRNFEDYKDALIKYSEKYYPELSTKYNDSSVGAWQIDLAADVADNLSYHIDRVYQETNIDSAQEMASLLAIARNNGVKVPGPKGAMAEVRITVPVPMSQENPNEPDYESAPIIKRGTRFASANQEFELMEDVDFAKQFDEDGNSNRTIIPSYNSNGLVTGYILTKLAVVTAGESKVYKQVLRQGDIEPFMEIILPVEGVMSVESILVVDGTENSISPSYGDFYSNSCSNNKVTRFYEVDSLAQSWAWLDMENNGKPVTYKYGYGINGNAVEQASYCVTRGEWRPIEHKFITEYTDKGYMKIIFGAGVEHGNIDTKALNGESSMAEFSKWQMSRILNNGNMGLLPKANTTLFVLYRIGGGKKSNVAKGAINRVSYLNAEFRNRQLAETMARTIRVENTTPSVSGKDMPSERELKYLIKYNKASQERCVTVKDYIDRILRLPPKYGTPFRVGVMEENNKIMVYLLGIDYQNHLDTALPITLVKNIENYLSGYRMINDFVEIKTGRIINLSFDVNVITDRNYNKSDIINQIITTVKNYMDVNKHFMGEEIYVSDIEKEISKIDGVINLISLDVFNEYGNGYSSTRIAQETTDAEYGNRGEFTNVGSNYSNGEVEMVDLGATDGILYNDGDTMMEIKYPENDIRVRVKEK